MSVFNAALGLCGLSLREAADFLGTSESTVKHWSAGRRPVPDGVWQALATLYDQIVEVSEHALDTLGPEDITSEALQDFAKHEHGSQLPPPAVDAAAAMFILTRLLDE
jgi:DNA-binding transcriptional regulator YdaS (Cro superfamily)